MEWFLKILSESLRLEEPWYIDSTVLNEKEQQVTICLDIRQNIPIACPACGKAAEVVYDRKKDRYWYHGDCLSYRCFIYCRQPRTICPDCGRRRVVGPWDHKKKEEEVCDKNRKNRKIESLSFESERWAEPWDKEDGNMDVIFSLSDNTKWVVTFITYKNILSLRDKNRKTGEMLNGLYFCATDMVIIEDLREETILQVLEDMIQEDEIETYGTKSI
jgi:uncharacterized Zn finger protein (UPF0148 family)